MQAFAAHGEEGAAFEHLHFHTLLEHVGGRGHGDVCRAGLGEQAAAGFREAGFDGGLVDGPRQNVGSAHGKGGGDGGGRGQATRQADADGIGIDTGSRRNAVPGEG